MALLLTSALFSLASCEDTNELGLDLPGTAPISTKFEDFAVAQNQAFTIRQDSLSTTQKGHFLVGRLTDGNTGGVLDARAFLEVAASSDSVPAQYATQQPKLDSVVIVASFNRVYGSATAPLNLSVYDLQQQLDDFTTYNSTSEVPLGSPIATNVSVPLSRVLRNKRNTLDSVALPLRIPLSTDTTNPTAFARQLFAKLMTTSTVALTDTELRSVWKGIFMQANSTGTVLAFNRSQQSVVNVYYHLPYGPNQSNKNRKRKVFRILFGDPFQTPASPRYFSNIRYTLNAAGSPFNPLQGNSAAQVVSTSTEGVAYAQDGTGLTTKIIIPGLDELKRRQAESNLVINRAELIIPVRPFSTGQFAAPSVLYMYEANNANNRILIYRNGLTQLERILQNGALVPTANSPLELTLNNPAAVNKYYSALVTGYVQAYAKNQLPEPAPTAFLLSPTRRQSGGELTLDRAAIDVQNIKLRVYYSETTAR